VLFGCHYFTYKHDSKDKLNPANDEYVSEDDPAGPVNQPVEKTNLLLATFKKMKRDTCFATSVIVAAIGFNLCQVYLLRFINNHPSKMAEFWSWLYLTNARTLYTACTGFAIMPLIL